MRKNLLPGLSLNPSSWGRLLLAAGLLLVFVQGLWQLHEVQNFFSPGRYQAIKLNLISKEYPKIAQALASLQDQLITLTRLQKTRAQPDPVPSTRPLSASPGADAAGLPGFSLAGRAPCGQEKTGLCGQKTQSSRYDSAIHAAGLRKLS